MRHKDEDKARRIKEAVIRLVLEQGFEGASVSKIAKEAGVSPSTVYVYYENKEQMLASIYEEYSVNIYEYLCSQVHCGMDGGQIVSALMHGYHDYIRKNYEIFKFLEQCAHCPSLCDGKKKEDVCSSYATIDEMRAKGIFKDYSAECLATVMFSPVKSIARYYPEDYARDLLNEVVSLIRDSILL